MLASTKRDLTDAARQWCRRPGHTAAVVLCLIAGLTVSIATYSAITSLLYGDQPGTRGRKDMVRIHLRPNDRVNAGTSVTDARPC